MRDLGIEAASWNRERRADCPRGLIGAIFGALGAVPLLPLARMVGRRLGTVPSIPGAERAAQDIKLETFAEAAAALILIPGLAVFFGRILPAWLTARSRKGTFSFEWAGIGMAAALPLWHSGARPLVASALGFLLASSIAVLIFGFRRSFAFRRMFARGHRRELLAVAVTSAAWECARLSNPRGARAIFANLVLDVVAAGGFGLLLAFAISSARGRPSEGVRAIARLCGVLLALCGLGIASGVLLPWMLTASALAAGLAPWIDPKLRPGWLAAGGLIFVGAVAATIYYQPYGPIDLFEDGHALAFADAYLHGAAPFRDTYPVHGWGLDGGVDAFFFRLFGPTVGVFRARRAIFTTIDLAALAVASRMALGSIGWGSLGLLLSLSICPFVSERTVFALVALIFLCSGMRNRRFSPLAWAGAFAMIELFFAMDMGVITIAGGLIGLGVVAAVERRIRFLFAFLAGAGIASVPFLLILATKRSLPPFLRASFGELPRQVLDVWGLPLAPLVSRATSARGFVDALSGGPVSSTFLIVLLAACVTIFSFQRRRNAEDDAILPALTIAIVALRGALGRAEPAHFQLYGAFAGLPAAWLFRRAIRKSWLFVVSAGALLWVGLHPIHALEMEISAATTASRERARLASTMTSFPRGGRARIPRDQAHELHELRSRLEAASSTGRTFFDFSNEPALYFLFGRRMPTPFLGPEFYETDEDQRRVIALCEKRQPPVVIARAGTGLDSLDGVPNAVRAPLVAEYLRTHYRPWTTAAGRVLLRRIDVGR